MIEYLIVYCFGIVTPILFKTFVLPKFKRWFKEKVGKWK